MAESGVAMDLVGLGFGCLHSSLARHGELLHQALHYLHIADIVSKSFVAVVANSGLGGFLGLGGFSTLAGSLLGWADMASCLSIIISSPLHR